MDTENELLKEKLDAHLKDFYKRENQDYFLPNNEQVQYNAIILSDLFYVEEFDNLFDGLDILYSEVHNECLNLRYFNPMLNYKKLDSRKTFYDKKVYLHLPSIINSRYGSGSPHNACYDLGSDIKGLLLTVYPILPSTIVLQIQANLLPHVSERINNIIYKCPEDIEIAQIEKDRLREDLSLSNLKKENTCGIKNEIKREIVDFISTFFKGFFFKKSKKCFSIIPCIDVYSLTYPNESKDIRKWLLDNLLFFECFNISIYNTGYRCEEYLFLENSDSGEPFNNYSILISSEVADKERYLSAEGSISYPLPEISFDLLCLYRWLEFTERHMRKFNEYITKELGDFTKNELKNLISNRHSITNELFYFERFKIEFKEYKLMASHKGYEFKFIGDPKIRLFETLFNRIKEENSNIDAVTEILNKHSVNNLSLKNIEYNNKMQDKVLQLTHLVIILTMVQIIIALIQIDLDRQTTLYLPLVSILIFILGALFAIFLNKSQY